MEFPKAAFLWRLHEAVANLEDIVFSVGVLVSELKLPIRVVELSVEDLGAADLLDVSTEEEWGENPFTDSPYKEDVTYVGITKKGIQEAENWSEDYYNSVLTRVAEQRGILEDENPFGPAIPASDRIVPLDHNSAEYRETVESVDKVIEELKKDQPLDNELGPQKHRLIQAVENARRLLDDTRMDVEIGVRLLLEPLILITKKYTQVVLGALASKAVDLVSKLLGLG